MSPGCAECGGLAVVQSLNEPECYLCLGCFLRQNPAGREWSAL